MASLRPALVSREALTDLRARVNRVVRLGKLDKKSPLVERLDLLHEAFRSAIFENPTVKRDDVRIMVMRPHRSGYSDVVYQTIFLDDTMYTFSGKSHREVYERSNRFIRRFFLNLDDVDKMIKADKTAFVLRLAGKKRFMVSEMAARNAA